MKITWLSGYININLFYVQCVRIGLNASIFVNK